MFHFVGRPAEMNETTHLAGLAIIERRVVETIGPLPFWMCHIDSNGNSNKQNDQPINKYLNENIYL